MSPLRFELLSTAPSGARAGLLHTRRGVVETPTFMPVATHAHARHLTLDDVRQSGAGVVLSNTFHLLLKPGLDAFEHFGGIHAFMGWDGGVLTDSGGFQVFSLSSSLELGEDGARFRSPHDNHPHLLSPEVAMRAQRAIGSDIAMVLDVCIPSTADQAMTRAAMERTHRWALRSLEEHAKDPRGQAVFGIVQGGVFPELRAESAAFLTAQSFDGFAIGGLAVGEARDQLYATCAHTARLLPADKPRYLMGVGTPIDLVEAVAAGVDMFDCILPTKMAQQGYAYTFEGQVRVSRTELRLKDGPLEPGCPCEACTRHPLGYLQHLANGGHALSSRLLGIHNLHHYRALMRRLREAILGGRLDEELRELRRRLAPQTRLPRLAEGGALGSFEVVELYSGAHAVRHKGHGEVMHPVGPWEEANRLYVDQPGLEGLLRQPGQGPLRILDVGLGAAANAVAALECARAAGPARIRGLDLVSLECDLDPLRLALRHEGGFGYLERWREAAEAVLEHGAFEANGLSWRLVQGDARAALATVEPGFDLVFQDPFSPEHNADLWTLEYFLALRKLCRDGAQVITYSSATPTRVGMLLAGFWVGTGVSTGSRAETTIASPSKERLAQPLGERWLRRWARSPKRAPHGAAQDTALDARVRAHPQFENIRI